MKLTILGTGTGRFTLERSSPSYLLEHKGKNILIDAGNSCMKQLLKVGKPSLDLDVVLCSHFHKDHYLELPLILYEMLQQINNPQFGSFPNKKVKLLKVYGPGGIKEIVKAWQGPGTPVEVKEIKNSSFKLFGLNVNSVMLNHGKDGTLGFRFKVGNKVLVYTSDSIKCPESIKLALGADVLVHSVGLKNPIGDNKDYHPSFSDVGMVASKAKVKKLVLTHFYPVAEKFDYLKDVRKNYKGKIIVAHDLMKIEI